MARCSICKKSATSGSNVSHAQNRTKRKFRPNIQKVNGILLCSKCIKTIKKINREAESKNTEMTRQEDGETQENDVASPKKEAVDSKKTAKKSTATKKAKTDK